MCCAGREDAVESLVELIINQETKKKITDSQNAKDIDQSGRRDSGNEKIGTVGLRDNRAEGYLRIGSRYDIARPAVEQECDAQTRIQESRQGSGLRSWRVRLLFCVGRREGFLQ